MRHNSAETVRSMFQLQIRKKRTLSAEHGPHLTRLYSVINDTVALLHHRTITLSPTELARRAGLMQNRRVGYPQRTEGAEAGSRDMSRP